MSLFGFGKKKEEKPCCSGGCNCEGTANTNTSDTKGADVKILGSGCAKCNQLEANTKEALLKLSMDTSIDHVTDFSQIAAYGVMTTPAVVYKGKVLAYGKVLNSDEIAELIKKAGG